MIIKSFKDLNKESTLIAGGKGASLGEMYNANFGVPNGFVVVSSVLNQILELSGIDKKIKEILSKLDFGNEKQIDNASKQIEKLVFGITLPDNIAKEITNAFDNLDCEYVAVRSSATTEDGTEQSWAGQFESYLNVKKKDLCKR